MDDTPHLMPFSYMRLSPPVEGTIIIERDGVYVFRQKGKAGADLPCTVAGVQARKEEERIIIQINKTYRTMHLLHNGRKGVLTRQARAAGRRSNPKPKPLTKRKTMAILRAYAVRELHAQGKNPFYISRKIGITEHRVRQILKLLKK